MASTEEAGLSGDRVKTRNRTVTRAYLTSVTLSMITVKLKVSCKKPHNRIIACCGAFLVIIILAAVMPSLSHDDDLSSVAVAVEPRGVPASSTDILRGRRYCRLRCE